MTTPFSGNLETDQTATRPDATLTNALAQQAPDLQVGRIPDAMRGPSTAELPNIILAAETNVPSLIDPDKGIHPVPEYTGFPYNTGYVPYRI